MEWIMIEKKWHEIAGKMQVSVPLTKVDKIARILGDAPVKKEAPAKNAGGLPIGASDKVQMESGAVV